MVKILKEIEQVEIGDVKPGNCVLLTWDGREGYYTVCKGPILEKMQLGGTMGTVLVNLETGRIIIKDPNVRCTVLSVTMSVKPKESNKV
jgi:hypothetical protein